MSHTVLILSLVSLLGSAPGRFVSESALALYHSVERGAAVVDGPVEEAIAAEVERVFAGFGAAPPARDPACFAACRVAAETLSLASPDASVSEVVRAALEYAGVTDAITFPFTLRTIGGEPPLAELAPLIHAHIANRGVTHVGVGVSAEPLEDGEHLITLVFTRRMIALGPFPREVEPGASALLWGRVPDDSGFPQVLVASPSGVVHDADVFLGDGQSFWCPLSFGRSPGGDPGAGLGAVERGTWVVEVLAGDRYGPQVATLFSVHVGEPAPRLPVIRLLRPDRPEADAAALEEQLLSLINRDRRAHGRRPLVHHRVLTAAARAHSADMARRDYFGHRGPSDGPVTERLARRGLRPSLASEAISIAPSTAQAHANLMRSPSHRRTLLDEQMTHAGVGVIVLGRGESRRLVITEELARLP